MPRDLVHRTPGRRRLYYPTSEDDDLPEWLVRVLTRHLYRVEAQIGTRLVRTDRRMAPALGCGSFGCVFRLEDGRVLKITGDEAEGPVTEWVRQKQQEKVKVEGWPVLASTARVDQVFRFPKRVRLYGSDVDPSWVYGIVREEVGEAGEVSSALGEAADLYATGWDTYCEASDESDGGGRVLGRAMAQAGLSRIRRCGETGRRLAALLAASWKRGVPLMDVHHRNLALRLRDGPGGAKRGQVIIFDFGGNPSVRVHGECALEDLSPILRDLSSVAQKISVLATG